MSKAIISEKAEPRELKALFIVGLDMRPNPNKTYAMSKKVINYCKNN